METQMQEMRSQIQTMDTKLKKIQPQTEHTTVKDLLKDTELSQLNLPAKNVTFKSMERSTTLAGLSGFKLLTSTTNIAPLR